MTYYGLQSRRNIICQSSSRGKREGTDETYIEDGIMCKTYNTGSKIYAKANIPPRPTIIGQRAGQDDCTSDCVLGEATSRLAKIGGALWWAKRPVVDALHDRRFSAKRVSAERDGDQRNVAGSSNATLNVDG